MGRSKTGQAISAQRRTPEALDRLDALLNEAEKAGDLATWKRARAVRAYVDGEKVADIHKALRVRRSTVNQWLRWYEVMGAEGLRTGKPPGAAPRLSEEQRGELSCIIEAGPMAAAWSRVGVQPRVDTFGMRKTAHVYGAVSVEEALFSYQFSPVFNGHTFHEFLVLLVEQYDGRKVFLIVDNGPCHWLDEAGKQWLAENQDRIELHRLPPYSPEFNPMEGVWKTTKRTTTHNRFFHTTEERDAALTATFERYRREPALIAGQVARYRDAAPCVDG